MNNQLIIDELLVSRLISIQFPQWKKLPIQLVKPGGWDNRTFRLGKDLLVRMPSSAAYAAQIEKECKWLPKLAPSLPLPIPIPLAMGKPGNGYPWKWSIYHWLEGNTATFKHIANLSDFAAHLARFLLALQRIPTTNGPLPGAHSFYRGGLLKTYDAEIRKALSILKNKIDTHSIIEIWETALSTKWKKPPVWVHGDISIDNLLVKKGQLSAVIDFGMLAIGDPACDLAISWTLFKEESRKIFQTTLSFDSETWNRSKAWTLWKALITAANLTTTKTIEVEQSWHIINEVLTDYYQTS